MSIGDYEAIENSRRRACKLARSLYDPEECAANERACQELGLRREEYLRDLLAQLPFRWHISHAYTAQETGSYGGADHIVVDEPIRFGRLSREPGDALSRPRAKFWGLHDVFEKDRLPTSIADIRIAERIISVPSKKDAAYAGYFHKPVAERDSTPANIFMNRGVESYDDDEIKALTRYPEEFELKSAKVHRAPPMHVSWKQLGDDEFRQYLRDKDYDLAAQLSARSS